MSDVLIVGGTGVFGCRLAQGLVHDGVTGVVLAARSLNRASSVAEHLGCHALAFDKNSADVASRIADAKPRVVVDAAGPFQSYTHDPYRLAKAAIAAGAHYFDLSDDAAFTKGITQLDTQAREAGVVVRSGVSSVPAISAAAVRALQGGLGPLDVIESVILPGNRAPRGRSVMRAILAQVGRPIAGTDQYGWVGSKSVELCVPGQAPLRRWASPIGAPDLLLFPEAFGVEDVRFSAGLELGVMHHGLGVIARGVKRGWLPSAEPLTGVLHLAAGALERFGTDVGGMVVTVQSGAHSRSWTLLAQAGDGPHVPAIPGRILTRKLLQGQLQPGAAPSLFDITLDDVQLAAPERKLSFHRS